MVSRRGDQGCLGSDGLKWLCVMEGLGGKPFFSPSPSLYPLLFPCLLVYSSPAASSRALDRAIK